MKEEGKIRHVGLSNVTGEELARAQKIVPIVTVQNRYNLADRTSERMTPQQSDEMIDICARQGIGFIPWGPLVIGDLARPGAPLAEIARERMVLPTQVVIAWMLRRSATMLPIPGTSSVKHLEENTLAATIRLTDEEFNAIDRSSKETL
jgi:aryl-alcohol dehydrogenase-like predicted oxidoreductase